MSGGGFGVALLLPWGDGRMGEEEIEGADARESQPDSRRCHDCGTESGVRMDGLRSGRSCIGGGGDEGAAAGGAAAEVGTAATEVGTADDAATEGDAEGAERGRHAEGGVAVDC